MARQRHMTSAISTRCPECSENLDNPEIGLRWRGPTVHCLGSQVAYHTRITPIPHHGHQAYPACWHCFAGMGCDQCAGPASEVLCLHCAAWTTAEALADHGPVLNTEVMLAKRRGVRAPELGDYPATFRAAWREQLGQDDDGFSALYTEYRTHLTEGPASVAQWMGQCRLAIIAAMGRNVQEERHG